MTEEEGKHVDDDKLADDGGGGDGDEGVDETECSAGAAAVDVSGS